MPIWSPFNELALVKQKKMPCFKQYQHILQLYWGGNSASDVIEQLTNVLIEHINLEAHEFALYRLWIEILAAESNLSALLALKSHIQQRFSEAEHLTTKAHWLALKALCVYELDQQEELRFIDAHLQDYNYIPYVAEYQYLRSLSCGEPDIRKFKDVRGTLGDYVYLATFAKGLLVAGRMQSLSDLLNYTSRLFDGAPLLSTYHFHLAWEHKDYVSAQHFATNLTNMYPHNAQYAYYKKNSRESSTLGGVLAQTKNMPNHLTISRKDEPVLLQNRKEHRMTPQNNSEQKCWLIKLTAREYFHLLSESFTIGQTFLRSIGLEPAVGDLCILASEPSQTSTQALNIVGACEVASEPQWDPVKGYETKLRLSTKIQPAITLDVEFIDSDKVQNTQSHVRTHYSQFQVYQLDSGAIDTLLGSLHDYREFEAVSVENLERRLDSYRRVS